MDNEIHVFILHYVFRPRINRVLGTFVMGWNDHPIRTEHNWSPNRIWTNAMIDRRNRNIAHISEMVDLNSDDDLEWYGMDWNAPTPNDDGLSTVDDISYPFDQSFISVMQTVDHMRESSSFGIDIYLEILSMVLN